MPKYEVQSFSQASEGIVTNKPTDKVIWADGRNVKFTRSETVSKKLGASSLGSGIGTQLAGLAIKGLYTFLGVDKVRYTIACTDTKIYAYENDGSTDFGIATDITGANAPTAGTVTNPAVWSFALVGGTLCINNGIDPFWIWKASNITYPASVTQQTIQARHISSFDNRLMLSNVIESAVEYTGRARWSRIANASDISISQDNKSGYQDFLGSEHSQDSIEFLQASSSPFIFTKEHIYRVTPAQEPWTFQFGDAIHNIGLVSPKAFTQFGGTHYFMSRDDFYAMGRDGSIKSIGFNIRNACFPNLNISAIDTTFVTYNFTNKEVHFHVPVGSSTTPNLAFIYNVEFGNWTIEDVVYNARTIAFQGSAVDWDSANLPFGSWDSITDTNWSSLSDAGVLPYEITGGLLGKIEKVDDTFNNADGTGITAYVETGDILGTTRLQDKHIREIIPYFKPQTTSSAISVKVGVRESLADTIIWSSAQPFVIGTDKRVTFRERGKYYRIRFESSGVDTPWALAGYEVKYFNGGFR